MNNRIKEFRNVRGLTVRQLSALSGYSHGFITAIENNNRNFSMKLLERIAEALEVQPQKLICPCCNIDSCLACRRINHKQKFNIHKK